MVSVEEALEYVAGVPSSGAAVRVTHRVGVLAGDGVGPEVIREARKAVDALGLPIEWTELPWGSAWFHEHGTMMPPDALEQISGLDAVLLGAIGDPSVPDHVSLWQTILEIRQKLDLWANLRPCRLLPGIPGPLAGRGPDDVDILFVRENTEGEYAGVGGRAHRGLPSEVALEVSVFTRAGCERILRLAFERAAQRRGILTSATKSNASRFGYVLWDEVAAELAAEFPAVRYEQVLVDALAARIVRSPDSLDVVVASNLFADILTDLGAAIQGGMGMAALGEHRSRDEHGRRLRARARVGAGHRRAGDRQPVRRDLERGADARAPRRGGRREDAARGAGGCLPRRAADERRRRRGDDRGGRRRRCRAGRLSG